MHRRQGPVTFTETRNLSSMTLAEILCNPCLLHLEEMGVDVETRTLSFAKGDLCDRCEAKLTHIVPCLLHLEGMGVDVDTLSLSFANGDLCAGCEAKLERIVA